MINALPPNMLVQVLDQLPVRVFWKDRESRFLGCNRLFAEDAGVADPNEFVGKSDYFFYQPQQADAFRRDDAEVMFNARPKVGILEKITRDNGDVIWLETSKFPMFDDAGMVIGVLAMYLDITERVAADDERCRTCVSTLTAA